MLTSDPRLQCHGCSLWYGRQQCLGACVLRMTILKACSESGRATSSDTCLGDNGSVWRHHEPVLPGWCSGMGSLSSKVKWLTECGCKLFTVGTKRRQKHKGCASMVLRKGLAKTASSEQLTCSNLQGSLSAASNITRSLLTSTHRLSSSHPIGIPASDTYLPPPLNSILTQTPSPQRIPSTLP